MLIPIENGDLYREWLKFYEKCNPELLPAEKRTYAFFNSKKGLIPPEYVR